MPDQLSEPMSDQLPAHLPSLETTGQWLGIAFLIIAAYGLLEMVWTVWVKRQESFQNSFMQTLKNFLFVIPAGAALSVLAPVIATGGLALAAHKIAPFHLPDHWSMWIVALLIYEFFYWLQHWLAHKVRLLWCIHSPHHAPNTIHMFVGYNHHFLESAVYMPFFLGFMSALAGVPPEMVVVISLIDIFWGNFLHISPHVIGFRYGPLERVLQTPSYHRVHHAQNPRYMDTNYNSITLFWDWVMGTKEVLRDEEPVEFGITRDVNTRSFWDVQFGEMRLLAKDVAAAPGLLNKLKYLIMPPGWSHTGDHKMASTRKAALALSDQ